MEPEVLVVGAGPGGCATGRALAEAGLRVTVVEEHQRGHHKACGEGVLATTFKSQGFEPGAPYVMGAVDRFSVTVHGSCVYDRRYPDVLGYTVDRSLFDAHMAHEAEAAGAKVEFGTSAGGFTATDGVINRIALRSSSGSTRTVRPKIVVGADGVASRVGRTAGLAGPLPPSDLAICVQTVVHGPVDEGHSRIVLGDFAPGGYAWSFARGPRCANVGVGVDTENARDLRGYLDAFLGSQDDLSACTKDELRFLPVPCGGLVPRLTGGNTVLVGDAARQNDPVSAGGILQAVDAGRMAAGTIVNAVSAEDLGLLEEYDRVWRKAHGGRYSFSMRLNKAVRRLPLRLLAPAAKAAFSMVKGDVFAIGHDDEERMSNALGRLG
jgi:digeranylgeranylglycerophospholipid reductase